MSQAVLAERTGIDQRQISRCESGQLCGYDKLITIANVFGIPVRDLFGEDDEQEKGSLNQVE